MPITHAFVSVAPPSADPAKVGSAEWNAQHVVNILNADVDPAAGIVESKLSLNFPTHAALTIGAPANGLSLAGQVLSIGLAASGVTGALSGTDWDTFNNKQAALAFPLVPNLGGTGIANAAGSTLTLGAATSITGGGTVALGGFTLTVPATGTAALLATQNIFTVPQTIDLSADGIGLTIQGAAAQTSNLFVLEDSGGADLLSVDATGRITQAATSADHTDAFTNNSLVTTLNYGTNPSTQIIGYDFQTQINNTVQISRTFIGARFFGVIYDSATVSWAGASGRAVGGYFRAGMESTSSISVPAAIGGDFDVTSASNRASWIATSAIAGRFNVNLQSNAAHTTANAYSLYVTSHVKNASITITNSYGLYIEDMTVAGTINSAIRTGKGLVTLGDKTTITGWQDVNQLIVTGFTTQTLPPVHFIDDTAATNVVRNVLQLEARSTGTAAAGFGPGLPFYAETATGGTYQQQGLISTYWVDATNASRKATLALSAYDTAERKGIEIRANGSTPDIALLGDTWWEGEGFGLPYGSFYGNDIAWTQAGAVQNTWYEIADADIADGQLNLVTHDGNGKLTVAKAGRYLINYHMTVSSSVANKELQSAISVSGTEQNDGIDHEIVTNANAKESLSSTAILDMAANATIEISIRTTDAGTPDISVEHINVTILMVGGT